jgi:hypothetical protein
MRRPPYRLMHRNAISAAATERAPECPRARSAVGDPDRTFFTAN